MLYAAEGLRLWLARATMSRHCPIVPPLVAIAAIAVIAAAIAGSRPAAVFEQLRFEAQSKGVGFVVLMLASIGLQHGCCRDQPHEGSLTS